MTPHRDADAAAAMIRAMLRGDASAFSCFSTMLSLLPLRHCQIFGFC
jgi:hypothetical protein